MKKTLFAGLATGILMFGMATMTHAALIAHWAFDETSGPTAFDSVGGVNGTLVSGATFTGTGGIVGGAIQITNGYVDMGNNFASTSTFSVQAWVKTEAGDTSGMAPVTKHQSGIAQGYFLAINNVGDGWTQTNTAGFYSANGGGYMTAVGSPSVTDGAWHQLVGVYDNPTPRIYIDGNLAGTGLAGFSDNGAHFMVGGFFNASGVPTSFFHGFIDEVKIFNTALSGDEVKELYDSTVNPIPLPATMLLLGSGLVGLAGLRRKVKK